MKLTSTQIENTLTQIDDQAIPDDHPAVPQLKGLYGDHTFFLGRDGLKIVEPTESVDTGEEVASVLKVASWADAERTTLAPHEPQATEEVIELGAKGPDAAD